MKRCISMILAVVLLLALVCTGSPTVHAAQKDEVTREIAIVFDNSSSMYAGGQLAWCRATYAMEVFASMLNKGDTLLVFPMSPIEVGGKEYTMDDPFRVTDASQAHLIREIYTPHAGTTPIESVDCAIESMKSSKADKKYLIVLTDGGKFWQYGSEKGRSTTVKMLDTRFKDHAGKDLTMMYLGIGENVADPTTAESEFFAKEIASNSEDTLAALTILCNKVFGRNALPQNRISGKTVNFDITMSKLIVFVQGENVSNVKLTPTDNTGGTLISSANTKYTTAGCGNRDIVCVPDTTLQGMMVTYENCAPGNYTLDYSGTATSVEIYYEPDAKLDFVFTDLQGKDVPAESLYAGEYKVSFGIKDRKTGKLISSDLLGNPHYEGFYSISGKEEEIKEDGYSGERKVTLKAGDIFNAKLTVTYLNGYTETKTAKDLWGTDGIQVQEKAAGELKLEISGGDKKYMLPELEEGSPYIAKVYYRGQQMTGDELKAVELRWDSDASNAEIKWVFAEDHYDLRLCYKDPAVPADTECGECTVAIQAVYTEPGCSEARAEDTLTYRIEDETAPFKLDLYTQEDYIVISELDKSRAIIAEMKLDGRAMTPDELASVKLQIDTGGIAYTTAVSDQDSSYQIRLLPTPGIAEGEYKIDVTALYADPIGRVIESQDSVKVTLSNTPLWIKWMIRLLILALLSLLLWLILRIKVLPKYMNTTRKLSSMNFDGDDVSQATNFLAEINKGTAQIQAKYAGRKFGVSMDVKPGKESYLYKPQKRRSAEVSPVTVRKFGQAKILEATIGSVRFVADEATGKLAPALPNQKPFNLTNGMLVKYSGTINDAGIDKDFEVTSKLKFTK